MGAGARGGGEGRGRGAGDMKKPFDKEKLFKSLADTSIT